MPKAAQRYDPHAGVTMVRNWIDTLKQKTGRTLDEWVDLLKKKGPATTKERKEWLKKEYLSPSRHRADQANDSNAHRLRSGAEGHGGEGRRQGQGRSHHAPHRDHIGR